MIYCERCGFANRQGSLFCNGCGLGLVAEQFEVDEPLPPWLRQLAVAGYLWKGEMILPEWLSAVRPFRELFGGVAVTLPPPYNEVVEDAPPPPDQPFVAGHIGDDVAIFEVDDEEGPLEADLLLLDDLDVTPDPDSEPSAVVFADVTTVEPDQSRGPDAEPESHLATDEAALEKVTVSNQEGESILEVLSGLLGEDGSSKSDQRIGYEEFAPDPAEVHLETADDDAENALLSAPDRDTTVVPGKLWEALQDDAIAKVAGIAPAFPESPETISEPSMPVATSFGVPGSDELEPKLTEMGNRFRSAVAFVLDPHPELPPRKARRKGRN